MISFGKATLDVAVADDREDALVDELADAGANSALLFGEGAVDVEEILHAIKLRVPALGVKVPSRP